MMANATLGLFTITMVEGAAKPYVFNKKPLYYAVRLLVFNPRP